MEVVVVASQGWHQPGRRQENQDCFFPVSRTTTTTTTVISSRWTAAAAQESRLSNLGTTLFAALVPKTTPKATATTTIIHPQRPKGLHRRRLVVDDDRDGGCHGLRNPTTILSRNSKPRLAGYRHTQESDLLEQLCKRALYIMWCWFASFFHGFASFGRAHFITVIVLVDCLSKQVLHVVFVCFVLSFMESLLQKSP